jgi:hypothetical protein
MGLAPVRRHLANLATVSQQLNETTDLFTHELKIIEAELSKLALGVEVTLPDPLTESPFEEYEGPENPPWDAPFLGYGRWGRHWKIKVRTFRLQEGEDSFLVEEKPLLEASRDLRMVAATKLEPLLELIGVEAKKKLDELREVVDRPRNQPVPIKLRVLECIADLFGRTEFGVTRQGGSESTSKLMKAANVNTADKLVEYLISLDEDGLLERNQRHPASFKGRISDYAWTEFLKRS